MHLKLWGLFLQCNNSLLTEMGKLVNVEEEINIWQEEILRKAPDFLENHDSGISRKPLQTLLPSKRWHKSDFV